jgi:release factor glutamine methyltransferase
MPNEPIRVWTIRELMKSAIEHLQRKGIEEARLTVELLLAHALRIQRIQLYLNFEKPLTAEERTQFRTLLERRLNHEPVQYIIGSANFMGLHFIVNSHVLIPRPETETLLEQVMMICREYPENKPIHIFEIGTGSGNIAISIAKFIQRTIVTTVDNSNVALEVALQNARVHAVESRIRFISADIFRLLEISTKDKYDLLVSNPPYIPKDEWEQLCPEIRDFEPSSALTDGKDGLTFYRQIIKRIPEILNPGGSVVLEVGYEQVDFVMNELSQIGIEQIQVTKDMQDIPRVITGIWMKSRQTILHSN